MSHLAQRVDFLVHRQFPVNSRTIGVSREIANKMIDSTWKSVFIFAIIHEYYLSMSADNSWAISSRNLKKFGNLTP